MALQKTNYIDDQTVISAKNLNDIQDAIVALETRKVNGKPLSSDVSLSANDVGAAPSGYGLGVNYGGDCADCNTATNNGWYNITSATAHCPVVNGITHNVATMFVVSRVSRIWQTIYSYTNATEAILQRHSFDSGASWSEWTNIAPSAFALAGYGLGTSDSNYISDCNSATTIGWYSLTSSTLNLPSATFATGTLRVERRGVYIMQTALVYNYEAKRNSSNGGSTWSAWVDSGPSAFAPAGYGLGGLANENSLADVNTAVKCGYYHVPMGVNNTPTGFGEGVLHVLARGNGEYVQELFSAIHNWKCRRQTIGGIDGWGEWEWENPPLWVGVEYRTTERFNGNVVYTKLIDFGALPAASEKSIRTGIPNAKQILAVERRLCSNDQTTFYRTLPAITSEYTTTSGEGDHIISVNTNDSWVASVNAVYILKYCG